MHLLGIDARADTGNELDAHGFAERLPAHAVKIVHAVEHDGQTAAQRLVPELAVLVHGRKSDAFPNGAAAEGGIADVGHDDAGFPVHALEERRAGRDGTGAAYDGVVGVDAERGEESVHGAAQAAVEPGFAREDFTVGAVDEKSQGQSLHGSAVPLLHGTQQRAVAVGSHDFEQSRIAELTYGGESLGQNFTVAAVRAENMVLGSQRESHTDGGGFLSDGEVRRTGVIVGDALIGALGLDLVENGFEFADAAHVPPDIQEVFGRIRGALFFESLPIRIYGNGRKSQSVTGKNLFGFYDD